MTQPFSHVRLALLAMLLIIEIALVVSLRTSGWIETGHAIRSWAVPVTIAVLPFIMTVVLLYRHREHLRRGQFSLRTLMAMTLVIASYLTLFLMVSKPKAPNTGPLPLSRAVKLEVFEVATAGTTQGTSFTDPTTGTILIVDNVPIITEVDVSTIELTQPEQDQGNSLLAFTLTPTGGNRLLKATTAANGSKLVLVVDGEVLAAPSIHSPVSRQFELSGGRISSEGRDVFRELTQEPKSSR